MVGQSCPTMASCKKDVEIFVIRLRKIDSIKVREL